MGRPGRPTTVTRCPYIDYHLPGHPGFGKEPAFKKDSLFPVAYLVKQEPESVIDPHFHRIDQFQVFVRGTGTFGRRPVDQCLVHYTHGYTAYGPIIAADQGIDYFTIRMEYDKGAGWMPAARDELLKVRDRPPRNIVYPGFVPRLSDAGGSARCLGSEPDGLAVWEITLAPRERYADPQVQPGKGQFLVVLEGSMLDTESNAELPALSVAFRAASDEPLPLIAGPSGACAVLLQFPQRRADE